MRRAFWAAGASTRVDVKLGAMVDRSRSKTRAPSEDWTDLDVLAVDYSPLHGASFTVADCKTVKGRVTERVFWLRGVADLFDARAAFLTRDGEIPPSSRQLALRLGIAALDASDRRALIEQLGDRDLPAAGGFLDSQSLQRWMKLTNQVPQTVDRLQRYRHTYYWLQRPRRNLTALPTAVIQSSAAFVPEQRWALAVMVDLAWLYLLSVMGALDDITRLHLSDVPRGLAQSILGGEQERREKEVLAEQLKALVSHVDPEGAAQAPKVPILPRYFDSLVDLISRVSRRRNEVNGAMRCLEFVGVETIACRGVSWVEAFPNASPVQAKLASDVIRFLSMASAVSSDFVQAFDRAVQGEPTRKDGSKRMPDSSGRESSEGPTDEGPSGVGGEAEPSTTLGQASLFDIRHEDPRAASGDQAPELHDLNAVPDRADG